MPSSTRLPSLLRPGSSPLTPYLPTWLLSQPKITVALTTILVTLALSSAVAPKPLTRCELIQRRQEGGAADADDEEQQGVERVVILGASSGCGADLALAYARESLNPAHPRKGVKLLLVARRRAELERVKAEIERELVDASPAFDGKVEVEIQAGDVSSPHDVLQAVQYVQSHWGGLDTLHLLAGLPSTETLVDATTVGGEGGRVTEDSLKAFVDEARKLYDVNCLGTLIATAAFLPLLHSTSRSPLVHHLSSVAGIVPAPTRCLYAATKAAGLAGFRTAAWEQVGTDRDQDSALEQDGNGKQKKKKKEVRFVSILPGTIDTDFRRKSSSAVSKGIAPAEGFDSKTLSVEDTTACIMHHCSLPVDARPVTLLRIAGIPLLTLPFATRRPKELVWLPEMPYRFAGFMLDTPLSGMVRRLGRKKYGLQ